MGQSDTLPQDEGLALAILQHALGVDQHGRGRRYRDYFSTGPGGRDHELCLTLVERGLMTQRTMPKGFGGGDLFFVTDAGKRFVSDESPPPPKLTRSQRRYAAWLAADSSMSFFDWVRAGGDSPRPTWMGLDLGTGRDLHLEEEVPF